MAPILSVRDLKTYFHTSEGDALAVDGVSFDVPEGETLALVGESGCGKSVTALSIMRLIASPPGRIESGEIRLDGKDLLQLSAAEMRAVRGDRISMIFQEPMTSLNPVFRVGNQIVAAIRLKRHIPKTDARALAIELFSKVGIPDPERRIDDYPHQLSGGMCQRVMVAMALASNPGLLIADEPTTALDVTIQAQILDLLRQLQKDLGMAVLLITHDLGIVAETAHRVAIMYAGKIVEKAPTAELFNNPKHPYTVGLFASLPRLSETRDRLAAIPGNVPAASRFPSGCRFHPRCPHATEICRTTPPADMRVGNDHRAACWLYADKAQ